MKQITFLFLILLASTALSASLAACASAPPPATVPHETLDTATAAPHPTEAPTPTATATATLTPEITVTEGSEWAKAGVPAGLTVKEVNNVFYAINLVGQKIKIGNKTADGTIKTEEFLKYDLTTISEDAVNNVWPLELVMTGGPGKKASLDTQPFPEDVVTGQDVEVYYRTSTTGIKSGKLRWSKEAQAFYDANPEKMPHKILGYFSVKSSIDGVDEIYIGAVHKWGNSDGTIRNLTYLYKDTFFYAHSSDQLVFTSGFLDSNADAPYKLSGEISKDSAINNLLLRWADTDSIPTELEDYALIGTGHEENHK